MKRPELIPFAIGFILLTYLMSWLPPEIAPYPAVYLLLSLSVFRRKALLYSSGAILSSSFLSWILLDSYIPLIGMAAAFLMLPVRREMQSLKLWERGLNALFALMVAYVSLVSPEVGIRVFGVLAALLLLSGERGTASMGLLMGSAVFMAIPLANLSDMNPVIFLAFSAVLLVYSLHHLQKLLR